MTRPQLNRSIVWAAALCVTTALAIGQSAKAQAAASAAPTLMKIGDILSGELNVMRTRAGGGRRVNTFQLVSEPRRLPPPNGLCNLETGPETFEIVTANDAESKQLKRLTGKKVSFKVKEVACAQKAGQMSEAIVTKWSVVGTP
ncbi:MULTISPECIES: hypothetical protein [Rhodopseudomonas]|uniref:Uncharacterized protein n=1 Tax=Rhodopseudomonas palustris TaxID=1076 RepID=A0A0D7ENY9_RHOPL|nr:MULTISPECIES: hypothetical protein [Rhodopseudomonas]KIZ42508.1 hypothetical protein OO17_12830 [Rhodopseudomonas palustris]MDF3812795.1 hypothetical protein [Rhodopseudomonas sp. BAL398]WOK16890.1 hypothetical protein RBJ75_22555 [Rhodopseudomonas sp. BAL398]